MAAFRRPENPSSRTPGTRAACDACTHARGTGAHLAWDIIIRVRVKAIIFIIIFIIVIIIIGITLRIRGAAARCAPGCAVQCDRPCHRLGFDKEPGHPHDDPACLASELAPLLLQVTRFHQRHV